jgi:hypothetical protein
VKAWGYRFALREGDVAKESIVAINDYAVAPSGETQEEGQARLASMAERLGLMNRRLTGVGLEQLADLGR